MLSDQRLETVIVLASPAGLPKAPELVASLLGCTPLASRNAYLEPVSSRVAEVHKGQTTEPGDRGVNPGNMR